MIKVGIIGATGYAGSQLVWLLNQHPLVEITFITSTSYSEQAFSQVYPNLLKLFERNLIDIADMANYLSHIDILFIALPHGMSEDIAAQALQQGVKVIDLGADFRLDDSDLYQQWYDVSHKNPALNQQAVYGLAEINQQKIASANLVACPGCYPTCAILALAPLLAEGLVNKKVIIDAKSGVSGAGRSANQNLIFCEVNENLKAYNLFKHRHGVEIKQELSKLAQQPIEVIFTPHLIPINRGILSTIYVDINRPDVDQHYCYQVYQHYYQDSPFVRVTETLPEIKFVKNSNYCDIGLRFDPASGSLIIVAAIDNLIKGASGQAVQNMNLMQKLAVETGLSSPSMYI